MYFTKFNISYIINNGNLIYAVFLASTHSIEVISMVILGGGMGHIGLLDHIAQWIKSDSASWSRSRYFHNSSRSPLSVKVRVVLSPQCQKLELPLELYTLHNTITICCRKKQRLYKLNYICSVLCR